MKPLFTKNRIDPKKIYRYDKNRRAYNIDIKI